MDTFIDRFTPELRVFPNGAPFEGVLIFINDICKTSALRIQLISAMKVIAQRFPGIGTFEAKIINGTAMCPQTGKDMPVYLLRFMIPSSKKVVMEIACFVRKGQIYHFVVEAAKS